MVYYIFLELGIPLSLATDYEGVSLTSRDANSKAAALEATNLFQSHYPELLVRSNSIANTFAESSRTSSSTKSSLSTYLPS